MIKRDWIDRNCCVSKKRPHAYALAYALPIQQVRTQDLLVGDVVLDASMETAWTVGKTEKVEGGYIAVMSVDDQERLEAVVDAESLVWIVDRSVLNYVPGKVELR